MPDFAPTATPRMRFGYRSAGFLHKVMVRCQRDGVLGTQQPAMEAAVGAVANALESLLPTDFEFLTGEFAAQDSDLFGSGFTLPTNPTGTQDIAGYTPVMRATETTFKGAGGGSKVSMTIFGVFWDQTDPFSAAANGQVEASEDGSVAAAIAALNAATVLSSIASAPVNWYPFATIKVNDHWLKLVRKLYP